MNPAFIPSPFVFPSLPLAPSGSALDAIVQPFRPSIADFLALNIRDLFESNSGAPDSQLDAVQPPPARAVTTSVIVNTWNHSAYIEDCIESLLVQTVLPDEIIVYDDGSDDDTVTRLRRYASRITLIQGKPLSLPAFLRQANAIQIAFARSTGQLIFLLDGADRFKRDKIQHYAAAYAADHEAALVQSPMDKIDVHGRILGTNHEPRKHVVEHLAEIYRQQDVDFYYPTSALAFARSYLDSVFPLDFSDGRALWIDTRLSIIAPYYGRVLTLPQSLTEWRRQAGPDSLRARSRNLQIQQTLMRTEVFNCFCRRYGLRTISAWRNSRFYKQLLRFSLPELAYDLFYHHVRPRVMRSPQIG